MSNSYTSSVTQIALVSEAAKLWLERVLFLLTLDRHSRGAQSDSKVLGKLDALWTKNEWDDVGPPVEVGAQWEFSHDPRDNTWSVIASHDENIDLDRTCAIFQEYLRQWVPDGVIVLYWASTCSRDLPAAFYGGAAVIRARSTSYMNSIDWCERQVKKNTKLKRTNVE